MIQITCTSCKRLLTIDDAFAGGVCRCQHCGTIQTVPARNTTQRAAAGALKSPRTLFENKARSASGGSGLEDLADIVMSSSGLSDPALRRSRLSNKPEQKNLLPLLGLAAAVIVVLLVILLIVIFRDGSPPPATSAILNLPAPANVTPAVPPPNFCGVVINSPVVVYLIDNGSSSADSLDAIKGALFKSIDSLGPERRFQVLFWNPDSDTYPTSQTAFAVEDNIDIAKKKLEDVSAAGSTDPIAGLKKALADDPQPGQIILVTAKAGDLDDSLVAKVMDARGSSTTRIDCFAINGVPGDQVLSKIATQTGGQFLAISAAKLKNFSY
jgi:hypothetical protein